MTTRRALLATLTLALAAPAALADMGDAPPWKGPARVRSQFQLDLPTLDLTPDSALLLPRGWGSVEVQVAHSNTFEITESYDAHVDAVEAGGSRPGWDFNVDGEVTRVSVRLDWAVHSRVQLGLEVPILAHSGGFLDSIIDQTHSALGTPTNDREDKDQDQLNIDMLSGGDRWLLDDSSSALGDIVARVKLGIVETRRAAFSVVAEAKLPTGEESALAGSGQADYGLTLLVSAGSDRHVFHGGLGYFLLGQPDDWPIDIEDRTSLFAGYEWRKGELWSLVTHVIAATSLLPDDKDRINDGPRAELAIGAWRGGDRWQLGFGVIENLTTSDNTPDLGLYVTSRWLWF